MRRITGAAIALLALTGLLALGQVAHGTLGGRADNSNPCDTTPSLTFCDSALGPLRDVTNSWRSYQPALLQPVPISDYCAIEPTCAGGDPEDRAPIGSPSIAAAGWCGTETVHQPSSGPQVPQSTEGATLPPGIPAPPGKHHPYPGSRYCLLRYLPADFAPLCGGCHRVLIDYAAIPAGSYNATSPAADGHWAARFTTDSSLSATTPVNEHSPNIKNLCADKFVNPGPGATCVPHIAQTDLGAHELEGDATIFHHFPFEGRYYNGPSYLAGDGSSIPFHWVNGAFFDVDPAGAATLPVWYNAGYRGLADSTPDVDQSYGCPCEVPPFGHTTWSPSLVLGAAVAASPTVSPPASPASSAGAGTARNRTPGTSTAHLPPAAALVLLAAAALAVATIPRRRRAG